MDKKNIVLCADINLYRFCEPLILSIQKNINSDFQIHLVTDNDFKKYQNQFDFVKEYNFESQLKNLNIKNSFKPRYTHLSTFCFARLLCINYFDFNKMLYLDIDTLITSPIDELFDYNLNDNVFGAYFEDYHSEFNTGVLLIDKNNYKKFKHNFDFIQIIKNMINNSETLIDDQSYINKHFFNCIQKIPKKYNFVLGFNRPNQAKIIHFAGGFKPWTNPLLVKLHHRYINSIYGLALYKSYNGKHYAFFNKNSMLFLMRLIKRKIKLHLPFRT